MMAAIQEELAHTNNEVLGFVSFVDGFELEDNNVKIELGARISQNPNKKRVLRMNVLFLEGALSRSY